ncbi:MAG TPA: methyltransferase domain-containing protein [Terriglobia bacterium]|nr:methyltransferase domain-containing protein [Terriglobia bacterium]
MNRLICDGESAATVDFFDQSAEDYYRSYQENSPGGYALRVRREKVLKLFDQPGGKVVDVGCGPAVMTQAMLERGCSFWGVDPSPRMIEISRKLFQENERVHFLSGDAMRMDFPDGQFDAVLCMGVIDALHDRHQAVREMLRVLKPGGTLIVSFTNLSSPYSWWKLYVFYPVVSVLKRIRQDLWAHMKKRVLFTERAAHQLLTSEGARITESVGYYYIPLDEIWPWGALWVTQRLEESRCQRLRWLAAGWIVKARKPSQ